MWTSVSISRSRYEKHRDSSGISGECHSNVRRLVELCGGKQLIGYGIRKDLQNNKYGFEKGIQFYGHSVWISPEGEVIDPTKSQIFHKYNTTKFIPIFIYQEDGVWSCPTDMFIPDDFEN